MKIALRCFMRSHSNGTTVLWFGPLHEGGEMAPRWNFVHAIDEFKYKLGIDGRPMRDARKQAWVIPQNWVIPPARVKNALLDAFQGEGIDLHVDERIEPEPYIVDERRLN